MTRFFDQVLDQVFDQVCPSDCLPSVDPRAGKIIIGRYRAIIRLSRATIRLYKPIIRLYAHIEVVVNFLFQSFPYKSLP